MTFAPIESVARAMAGFPRHWWVSGGWSIDLFVGDVTRTHEDLEVGIARADQRLLQEYLTDRSLCKAVQFPEGGRWVPWEPDERLELPVFQIQARRDDADPPEFEIFLNDIEDGLWRFRRDLTFTRPADELTLTSARDLPIIAPEIQLLYKAKGHRDKDEHDFRTALPHLSIRQREWLRRALEANHPGDPWLAALARGPM